MWHIDAAAGGERARTEREAGEGCRDAGRGARDQAVVMEVMRGCVWEGRMFTCKMETLEYKFWYDVT